MAGGFRGPLAGEGGTRSAVAKEDADGERGADGRAGGLDAGFSSDACAVLLGGWYPPSGVSRDPPAAPCAGGFDPGGCLPIGSALYLADCADLVAPDSGLSPWYAYAKGPSASAALPADEVLGIPECGVEEGVAVGGAVEAGR
jgi:hypothetical protein